MSGVAGGRRSDGGDVHDMRNTFAVTVRARYSLFARDLRIEL